MDEIEKVAIVTGGSRGIGAATAKLLAAKGYAVCVNYVSNGEVAEGLAEDINKHGGRCIVVQADVGNETDVDRLFNTVDKELGTVSGLVNNAGILRRQSDFQGISTERFQNILNTNLMGTFYCCQQAIKRMSSNHGGNGGCIVNVSSKAALTGAPFEYVDYAASKAAVESLTIGLAKELANQAIRVNGVRPGFIHTDIHATGGEANRIDRLAANIPMKRGGCATEVAEAIYWLLSDKSSFTTGSFIDVSGGL